MSIRPATIDDCNSIVPLLAQLGYPTEVGEVRPRLQRLLAIRDGGVLVAEVRRQLVGLASFQMLELIYRPRPQCRITALVVCSEHRRGGIGTALVRTIERIAHERGCFRLELTTRQDREDALPFYTALGFGERPHRLVKTLRR